MQQSRRQYHCAYNFNFIVVLLKSDTFYHTSRLCEGLRIYASDDMDMNLDTDKHNHLIAILLMCTEGLAKPAWRRLQKDRTCLTA